MNYSIKVKDLSFSYKKKNIFNNITFAIPENKITFIIGANGCGKTTLLKLMSKILSDYTGKILINSRDIKSFSKKEFAKTVSFLFSEYTFIYPIKVIDFLLMALYPYKKNFETFTDKDYEYIKDISKFTGILKFLNTPITNLSSGEKQIVYLTHILIQNTPIILLDEPLSHLDLKHKIIISNILKKLRNKSIVIVSHDTDYISRLADYTILLKDRNIFKTGHPSKILTKKNKRILFDIYEDNYSKFI